MCFNRESDGREKWRFGLDDKNIYTVVRDCDRKLQVGTHIDIEDRCMYYGSKYIFILESSLKNPVLNSKTTTKPPLSKNVDQRN